MTVGGTVAPGTRVRSRRRSPSEYWRLHTQPEAAWELEVAYRGLRVACDGRRSLPSSPRSCSSSRRANEGHLNHWGITIVLIVVGVCSLAIGYLPVAGLNVDLGTAATLAAARRRCRRPVATVIAVRQTAKWAD